MTPELLAHQLSSQYELVCFEDFAKLTANTKSLYAVLEQHKLAQYQPQQRLVFYTQHRLSLNQLCHFQLAAALVDISNSFIILCTPYDLTSDLIIANQQHGYDHTVIECKIISVDSQALLTAEFASLDTLCPLPWMHLNVGSLGDITSCCHSAKSLGHIQQHQMKDVFFGESMQHVRSQMLHGQQPESCQLCFKQEAHNKRSPRNYALDLYKKPLLSTYLDDVKIRSLDLKLGNTCNFKCKICNKDYSSQHASEELKYTSDVQQLTDIRRSIDLGQWYDHQDNFSQQLDLLWANLINIDILGGEPFLLKTLPSFLDQACQLDHASHIRLHFNTNGSVWPENLIDTLCKFQFVDIGISIDNIGPRFEIERGGVWHDVEQNVHKFLSLPPDKFKVYLYCTVNAQNVLDLDELYNWAESIGIGVMLSWLEAPSCFSIENLTDQAKHLVISKYQNSHQPDLRLIADLVRHSKGSDGTDFVAAIKQFDQRRQQNFILSHQPIAIAMGFAV
jgi:MoaA/NifB/PqqE/SkfB family radical SAM enzyme